MAAGLDGPVAAGLGKAPAADSLAKEPVVLVLLVLPAAAAACTSQLIHLFAY